MNFADRLHSSISTSGSFIVAGFDPRLESFPTCYLKQAASANSSNEDCIHDALLGFYKDAVAELKGRIAAVKPNSAFFEALGMGGLRALFSVHDLLRDNHIPIVADAKRGDIGSTAKAYSAAFLGKSSFMGKDVKAFNADALTVNPYLGFDTLEAFLDDCREYGKGLFVLVKTSNPGSASIQGEQLASGSTISKKVAAWLHEAGQEFIGSSGYSSVGAVVGATYPEEARELRKLMPDNFFLIPGLGSQGGTADDAVAGFSSKKGGAIINVSRGLLSSFSSTDIDEKTMRAELRSKIDNFNSSVKEALA